MIINTIKNSMLICSLAGLLICCSTKAEADSKENKESKIEEIVPEIDTLTVDYSNLPYKEKTKHIPGDFIIHEVNVITNPERLAPVFDSITNGSRPVRILQIGDSHVAGIKLPTSIKENLCSVFGEAKSDSKGKGIYFTYFAKNGFTAKNFVVNEERIAEIKKRRPDLIIMSFGGNEYHGMSYRVGWHRKGLKMAIDKLREECPYAVILLTTPTGDFLTQKEKYYVTGKNGKKVRRYKKTTIVNPMVVPCVKMFHEMADSEGLPLWDLNAIAGGEKAAENWASHKLMQKDHVHFILDTYIFQGGLFCEAFLKAYNDYIKNSKKGTKQEVAAPKN